MMANQSLGKEAIINHWTRRTNYPFSEAIECVVRDVESGNAVRDELEEVAVVAQWQNSQMQKASEKVSEAVSRLQAVLHGEIREGRCMEEDLHLVFAHLQVAQKYLGRKD